VVGKADTPEPISSTHFSSLRAEKPTQLASQSAMPVPWFSVLYDYNSQSKIRLFETPLLAKIISSKTEIF
jgi:hypothetical protein